MSARPSEVARRFFDVIFFHLAVTHTLQHIHSTVLVAHCTAGSSTPRHAVAAPHAPQPFRSIMPLTFFASGPVGGAIVNGLKLPTPARLQ